MGQPGQGYRCASGSSLASRDIGDPGQTALGEQIVDRLLKQRLDPRLVVHCKPLQLHGDGAREMRGDELAVGSIWTAGGDAGYCTTRERTTRHLCALCLAEMLTREITYYHTFIPFARAATHHAEFGQGRSCANPAPRNGYAVSAASPAVAPRRDHRPVAREDLARGGRVGL